MNVWIHWIDDNPNVILCSFRAFDFLGGELLGLPLEPHAYCADWSMYGIDDTRVERYEGLRFKCE